LFFDESAIDRERLNAPCFDWLYGDSNGPRADGSHAISIGPEEREMGGSCARDDVGCINASVPAEIMPFNAFLRVNGLSIGRILFDTLLFVRYRV
jgi:hypothetical protein